jgi:hypothetical protein
VPHTEKSTKIVPACEGRLRLPAKNTPDTVQLMRNMCMLRGYRTSDVSLFSNVVGKCGFPDNAYSTLSSCGNPSVACTTDPM